MNVHVISYNQVNERNGLVFGGFIVWDFRSTKTLEAMAL